MTRERDADVGEVSRLEQRHRVVPRRAQDVGEHDEDDDDERHLKPDEHAPPAEKLEGPLHPINSRASAYCRGERAP